MLYKNIYECNIFWKSEQIISWWSGTLKAEIESLKSAFFKQLKCIMTLQPCFQPCHSPAGAVGWCQESWKGIICFLDLWELLTRGVWAALQFGVIWDLKAAHLSEPGEWEWLFAMPGTGGKCCAGQQEHKGSGLSMAPYSALPWHPALPGWALPCPCASQMCLMCRNTSLAWLKRCLLSPCGTRIVLLSLFLNFWAFTEWEILRIHSNEWMNVHSNTNSR